MAIVEPELDALFQLAGVTHAILARQDGHAVAAAPPARPEHKNLAATLAGLRGTSDMAMHQSEGGMFSQALIRGENREILCVSVGPDAVLGVVADKGALTGLLLMAVEAAAIKILRALQEGPAGARESTAKGA